MPHIHWAEPDLPESDEALELQAQFLARHTGAVTAPIETLQRRTLARDEERRGLSEAFRIRYYSFGFALGAQACVALNDIKEKV
jgi:hypothetical protein